MLPVLTAIATIAQIAGAGYSIFAGFQQNEKQKEAERAQNQMMQAQRTRRSQQLIAARNRARASIEAQGVSQGISQSSAVQGALGAVSSQTASQIGFNQFTETISDQIANKYSSIRSLDANASMVRGVGKVLGGVESLFGTPQKPTVEPGSQATPAVNDLFGMTAQQGAPQQAPDTGVMGNVAKGDKMAGTKNTARSTLDDPFGLNPFGEIY